MFIGLFTSRVVLNALGVEDYGVYGAVGGLVMMFTVITNSVSQSISRFITWHLGAGVPFRGSSPQPPENLGKSRLGGASPSLPAGTEVEIETTSGTLHRVFSTAVILQLFFCALLLVLTETLGIWWLETKMNIPPGRMTAARWVLQCSMGVLMVNLFSVPFNATIISHERMDLFAWISIAEAILKLSVAILIAQAASDKLILYAILMLGVAIIVRLAYGITCHRLFPETRGRAVLDRKIMGQMGSFAGWNVLGSGSYIVNTQGINQLANIFFGVAVNGARLVAQQVENILKQFVTNLLTALNPQITKSYAGGKRDYSFTLTGKGVKYSGLILLALCIPLMLEAQELLRLWLKDVPEFAIIFTRLTLICLTVDLLLNPLVTLIQAEGRIKSYYIVSSVVALSAFAASWIAFKAGAPAYVSYIFFAAAYLLVDITRIIYVQRLTGYKTSQLFDDALGPVLTVALLGSAVPVLLHFVIPGSLWRPLAVLAATALCLPPVIWSAALTGGEREFVLRKIGRFLPDSIYLRMKYRAVMGTRLHLCRPRRFTEKLQWLKLHDRNSLYHTMVDKAEVKRLVAGKIGAEHVIPTLGVWESPEQIDWDALPEQFVLKCTHDSGSTIICKDKTSLDRSDACARISEALSHNYWKRDREWAYKGLQPRIIAEPYIGAGLKDYKIFCFGGVPQFLFVASDRDNPDEETKFDFFTPEWEHMPLQNGHPNATVPPQMPDCLEDMLALAACLSQGIPQVRIDFYAPGDGRILFGEYTFYHWSGFVPFEPESEDLRLGELLKLPRK